MTAFRHPTDRLSRHLGMRLITWVQGMVVGAGFLPCTLALGDPGRRDRFFRKPHSAHLDRSMLRMPRSRSKGQGGLRLDIRQGWHLGGDSGPSILPGQPQESLLIEAIGYGNPDLEMPPKGKLPQTEIDLLTQWVRLGAPDPRDGAMQKPTEGLDLEAGRSFWSFQPIAHPTPPQVLDAAWPLNEVDRFIRSEQEAHDIQPNPEASPAQQLRRLSFDLTGLPPIPTPWRPLKGPFRSALPPAGGVHAGIPGFW